MLLRNTTAGQDDTIREAKEIDSTIGDLLDIIEDLDTQVSAWKLSAAEWDCDNPSELKEKILSLPDTY